MRSRTKDSKNSRIGLSFACLMLAFAVVGFAAEAVVTRKATLRKDPSTAHPPIRFLLPDDEVELIDSSTTHGYYHVKTDDDLTGWVYGRSLRIRSDAGPGAPPSPTPPGTSPPSSGGPVADTVSPDWDKPQPNQSTYDGPDGTCGPTGDGGDSFTNQRKNRTDIPTAYHDVTWQAIADLKYPVAPRSLADWSDAQKSQIMPVEGIPVRAVGYFVAIKVEDRGSGESTNCHFVGKDEVDWHMPLVQRAGDGEKTAIVVETTPRIRQSHPQWTPEALARWVNSDLPVRISGYLMFDPEHRAHLGVYRSTLWEIHPITRIEVCHAASCLDTEWIDLDQL